LPARNIPATAPGFMSSCATDPIQGMGLNYCQKWQALRNWRRLVVQFRVEALACVLGCNLKA